MRLERHPANSSVGEFGDRGCRVSFRHELEFVDVSVGPTSDFSLRICHPASQEKLESSEEAGFRPGEINLKRGALILLGAGTKT